MKILKVEVVGSICVVKDDAGNTVLEVVGDKVHWSDDNTVGNSDIEFVLLYRESTGDDG